MIRDAANTSQFAAELLVEELARLGVVTYFVSPGSRSAPIVVAAARHPSSRCFVHYDERGSAYAALGYGRATGSPAAWVATSGTAVANGLPAFVEAATDGVPLLALTADRPPELRRTGANQTIHQPGIFGPFATWEFDMPASLASADPCSVLSAVDQAVYRCHADRGPVHLNWMFREPLAPDVEEGFSPPEARRFHRWISAARPFTTYGLTPEPAAESLVDEIVAGIVDGPRGVVVAGRLRSPHEGAAAEDFARRIGWPLLPDVLSFVRGSTADHVVNHFDLLLASKEFRQALRGRPVLHFGERATSKRLYQFLSDDSPGLFVLVSPRHERVDPVHAVTHRVEADVTTVCGQVLDRLGPSSGESGLDGQANPFPAWNEVADRVVLEHVDDPGRLTEPWIGRYVARNLPAGHELFLGSSMPIRDVDSFADRSGRLMARGNRGASGIDGTVATAVGVAIGRGGPVTVLLGDLSLLHDLNSLGLVSSCEQQVIVVVVNNNGGGIFSFLPISEHAEVFEPYFGTPHDLSFASVAKMFGLRHRRALDSGQFADAFEEVSGSGFSGVIEAVTERSENRRVHEDLLRAVCSAVRPRATQRSS